MPQVSLPYDLPSQRTRTRTNVLGQTSTSLRFAGMPVRGLNDCPSVAGFTSHKPRWSPRSLSFSALGDGDLGR